MASRSRRRAAAPTPGSAPASPSTPLAAHRRRTAGRLPPVRRAVCPVGASAPPCLGPPCL
eukprot:5902688-Pleurochrysis_carterae.AAC.2